MKQKLWIVTELFPPDETSTSYIMGEIANAMVQKYQVGVICGPEVYDTRKKLDSNSTFRLNESIIIHRTESMHLDKNTFSGKGLSFLMMSWSLMSLVKKYVKKGDKVLMVTNPAPMVPLMAKLKHTTEFELSILVHDIFPENTKPAGIKLPMFGLIKRIFDKAYASADQLIALGRDMADVLESKIKDCSNFKEKKPKISIVENWADIENIEPQPFPIGKIILEYAGNIGRVQGLEKVVDLLPKNVELHIYGTGAIEEKLKARARENVFFHGPYLRSQQNEVLAACDIALVTLQEGMYGLGVPSKIYNILASGRPVLFFGPKGSEIDLLIRENGIGYCDWPEKWDKSELADMGMRARKLAENKYSEKIILDKFLQLV